VLLQGHFSFPVFFTSLLRGLPLGLQFVQIARGRLSPTQGFQVTTEGKERSDFQL
jgi:hypothetical protein